MIENDDLIMVDDLMIFMSQQITIFSALRTKRNANITTDAFISSYSTDYFVDDKFNAANTIGSFTLYMSSESFDVK